MSKKYNEIIVYLLCVVAVFTLSGCDNPFEHSKCRTVMIISVPSSDGKYEAVLEERYCKPENDKILDTRITVRKKQSTSTLKQEELVFLIADKHTVNVLWLDSTHLQIEVENKQGSTILSKSDKWDDVSISYKIN